MSARSGQVFSARILSIIFFTLAYLLAAAIGTMLAACASGVVDFGSFILNQATDFFHP
jgi:hypothetical protein